MDPSWDIKHIFSIPISTPFPTWNEPGTPPFSPRRNRISVSRRCGTLCSVAFFPSVRGDWNDERRATRNATRDATRRGLNAERSREPKGVNSKVENWIEQMVMIGCRDMFSLLCIYIYVYIYIRIIILYLLVRWNVVDLIWYWGVSENAVQPAIWAFLWYYVLTATRGHTVFLKEPPWIFWCVV